MLVIWHEDDISKVAREIKITKTFCYNAMNKFFKRYFEGSKLEKYDEGTFDASGMCLSKIIQLGN